MDGNDDARRRRGWTAVLGVLVLLAVVAVAASGDVATGEAGIRRPAPQLLDVALSLLVVLMAIGAVVAPLAYMFFSREAARAELGVRRARRRPVDALVSAVVGLALVGAALVAVHRQRGDLGLRGVLGGLGQGDASAAGSTDGYDPQFATGPVAIALGLAALAALAVWLELRGRRRAAPPRTDPASELVLAEILDDTLDDLRQEADPRRAVLAAYARMEVALAAAGLPRRAAEAPEEYLDRIVDGIDLGRRSVGRLTSLFAWARFSGHDVQPGMKDEAIQTLEALRDELRAAALRREALAEQARHAAQARRLA